MKYEVSFTASVRDREGPTNVSWWASHEVEIERLADLIPMMASVEKVVEEWKIGHARPQFPPGSFVGSEFTWDLRGVSTAHLRKEWELRKAQGLPGTEE